MKLKGVGFIIKIALVLVTDVGMTGTDDKGWNFGIFVKTGNFRRHQKFRS